MLFLEGLLELLKLRREDLTGLPLADLDADLLDDDLGGPWATLLLEGETVALLLGLLWE